MSSIVPRFARMVARIPDEVGAEEAVLFVETVWDAFLQTIYTNATIYVNDTIKSKESFVDSFGSALEQACDQAVCLIQKYFRTLPADTT